MKRKPANKIDGKYGVYAVLLGLLLFVLMFPFSEWARTHKLNNDLEGFMIFAVSAILMFGGPILFFWGIWKIRDENLWSEFWDKINKNQPAEPVNSSNGSIDEAIAENAKKCYNNNMYVKVYHITSLDNLKSIQKKGILSRASVEQKGYYTDIAEHRALNNHRNLSIDGIPLDKYARCFFNPLPPMYYNRINEGYEDLCVIELHIPVKRVVKNYYGKRRVFHNLVVEGARYPRMYKKSIASHQGDLDELEVHNLDKIEWDSSRLAYKSNRDETIACRGAELLVYPKIPADYIYKVYSDTASIARLEKRSEQGCPEICGEDDDDDD